MVPQDYKIHCHCFTGDFTSAKLWLDHFPNLYIGLTPLVTYRTAIGARDVAKFISLGRLLLESDAPYFVPKTVSTNFLCPARNGWTSIVLVIWKSLKVFFFFRTWPFPPNFAASLGEVDSNLFKYRATLFPRGDYNEIRVIHWWHLKTFFFKPAGPMNLLFFILWEYTNTIYESLSQNIRVESLILKWLPKGLLF